MNFAKQLDCPKGKELALDFGCVVERLTRALAKYFNQCYGVDISEIMVAKATNLNKSIPGLQFIVNAKEHLHIFPDNHFDMIYSGRVLQHIPEDHVIKFYISEFVCTLKADGLLIFQLPSCPVSLIPRLRPRSRLYSILKPMGFNKKFLYKKL